MAPTRLLIDRHYEIQFLDFERRGQIKDQLNHFISIVLLGDACTTPNAEKIS